jgi:hypothetical protein
MQLYQLYFAVTKLDDANEPTTVWRPASSLMAASEKDAQSKFNAILGPLRFGGRFPNAYVNAEKGQSNA